MRGAFLLAPLLALEAPAAQRVDPFQGARERLVLELADTPEPYRITDPRVLDALRRVPRERFVPPGLVSMAYADRALPIGKGQTISQPYMVAAMTQALALRPTDRVLEVGTGSGYQAAVLSLLAREVYSVEIIPALAESARRRLAELRYDNVRVRAGDGYAGWPDAAPFDAVIVTCAPEHVPEPLVRQLKVGGRLVIPLGPDLDRDPSGTQTLWVMRKTEAGLEKAASMPVRFVPMTGEVRRPKS
ncbi:MAG: protein-L-isoaspartate(D-aspartate) O-methyltransferase [Elusimicrobia bacterium]|nr:protein-L-isoaspartate(D-aspartate) O-methyltransferase [Elusimicrobiota bacterium]